MLLLPDPGGDGRWLGSSWTGAKEGIKGASLAGYIKTQGLELAGSVLSPWSGAAPCSPTHPPLLAWSFEAQSLLRSGSSALSGVGRVPPRPCWSTPSASPSTP